MSFKRNGLAIDYGLANHNRNSKMVGLTGKMYGAQKDAKYHMVLFLIFCLIFSFSQISDGRKKSVTNAVFNNDPSREK